MSRRDLDGAMVNARRPEGRTVEISSHVAIFVSGADPEAGQTYEQGSATKERLRNLLRLDPESKY